MTKNRVRRQTPGERALWAIEDAAPMGDESMDAIGDDDVGLDRSAFYRWRRVQSDRPPAYEPSEAIERDEAALRATRPRRAP